MMAMKKRGSDIAYISLLPVAKEDYLADRSKLPQEKELPSNVILVLETSASRAR
jgi:hypothetical protein